MDALVLHHALVKAAADGGHARVAHQVHGAGGADDGFDHFL